MLHLALWQAETMPSWVGPTVAISLVVVALSFLAIAIAVAVAAMRVAAQIEKLQGVIERLQDDAADVLKSARRVAEQGQDLITLVRHEAGAFVHTSRRLRRKVMRGADRVEQKLTNLETLYDVVHDEVEDAALGFASRLRSARGGVLNRMRQLFAAGRR